MSKITEAKIAYVLDFDGTITENDASSWLAAHFGGSRYRAVEDAYRRRDFGMKGWLKQTSALLPADLELMLKLVVEQAVLRPGFKDFLHFARDRTRPVYIASDGFGFYLEPILQKYDCLGLISGINKNEAVPARDGKTIEIITGHAHAHCPVCGNCKAALVVALQEEGYRVIYAGDGSNDRFGASRANLVFARDSLAVIFGEKALSFTPWRSFHDLINDSPPGPSAPTAPLCDPRGEGAIPE